MLSTVFFAYMQVHSYSKIYLLKYFNIHVYVNYLLMSKACHMYKALFCGLI